MHTLLPVGHSNRSKHTTDLSVTGSGVHPVNMAGYALYSHTLFCHALTGHVDKPIYPYTCTQLGFVLVEGDLGNLGLEMEFASCPETTEVHGCAYSFQDWVPDLWIVRCESLAFCTHSFLKWMPITPFKEPECLILACWHWHSDICILCKYKQKRNVSVVLYIFVQSIFPSGNS